MIRRAVLAAAALLVLTGCAADPWEGTQLDMYGWLACDNLSRQISTAGGQQAFYDLGPMERDVVAIEISASAGNTTTPGIADDAAAIKVGADGSAEDWRQATDAMAATCGERGFPPAG